METNQNKKNSLIPLQPVLGSAVGGLRFELVLNKTPEKVLLEELEVPFAILSIAGNFSQTLLARIAMGDDTTIRYFALKIQRNDYPARQKGAMIISNDTILKLWEIERNNLANFSGNGKEIVELFDFGTTITTGTRKKESVLQSKPISFCKRMRVYFHPLCPECTCFLEDCRNESLLASNGLPGYRNSSVRYLYCPRCAKKSKDVVFYTYSLTPEELPGTKAAIHRRSQLYRDFIKIIHNKASLSKSFEVDQFLTRVFPCFACDYQNECYPPGTTEAKMIPAEGRITPVSYYECVMLPLELLHIHYDDFCDLLGGSLWSEFQRLQVSRGLTFAQQLIIDQIQPFFTSSYQFIFKDDPTGLFALEILRLKLIAFTQLCRGVQALHARCHQPHLDIRPGSVMAMLSMSGRDLPARWNFSIKLLDLGSTFPFDQADDNHECTRCIFYPPHNFQKLYTSPIIHGSQFGYEERMDVNIKSVTAITEPKGKIQAQIEAELKSRAIKARDFCKRDLIRIDLTSPARGLGDVTVWASRSENYDHDFRVIGRTIPISANSLSILEQSVGAVFFDTQVAFYKTLHIPCDVYSLGVMLLRTILVNDQQDLWQVMEDIDRMIFRLQDHHVQHNKPVEERLKSMIQEQAEKLAPGAIFYRSDDREKMANAISTELWNDILVFAFKLLTNIKGFSFCEHHGDYHPDNPGTTMARILTELEDLNTHVHADLFGSRAENKEILELCDEFLKELRTVN